MEGINRKFALKTSKLRHTSRYTFLFEQRYIGTPVHCDNTDIPLSERTHVRHFHKTRLDNNILRYNLDYKIKVNFPSITSSLKFNKILPKTSLKNIINWTEYSRVDQVKLVEDNL